MGQKYDHLGYEDRVKIEHWQAQGRSIRFIARELGRSPNTISYELSHLKVSGEYTAKKACVKSYQKRYYARAWSNKVARDKELRAYVDARLDMKWSPKTIAKSLAEQRISQDTIYRYVTLYALQHKLYFKGKPRKKKTVYRHSLLGERKWIDERLLGDELGHYELDFIVSRHSPAVLLVAVDTLSKQTMIELLPNRTKPELAKALLSMFGGVTVKTILTDNDIAFRGWQYLEELLGSPFYFTHPYHSWEKGLVENTNKWIRHFVPKKADIQAVTKEKIRECLAYLNDRPREVLGFKTANQVYLEQLTLQA
jgi:IS30 family transposase